MRPAPHHGSVPARSRPSAARAAALLAVSLAAAAPARGLAQGLPPAAPEDVGLSSAALARLEPAVRAYVDSGKLGGVLVAVARHGRVAYLRTVGRADLARGTPLAPDAVFRIYSMTKPVTAVAALQLVERGKLRLDDPVSAYVPAFAGVRVYAGGPAARPATRAPARPVTVRDLFAHTSGLAYGFGSTPSDSLVRAFGLSRGSRTLAEFADSLARIPLAFAPGERWSYSPGLDVLGRVVEVVDGRPFDRYLDEEVFRPLGMRSTAFRLTPALRARLATVYERGADGRLRPAERLPAGDNYDPGARFVCGGCGLVSTAGDYLRFAQMLLNGGTLDGARLLRPETVALMRRNVLTPALLPTGPDDGFGLGVAVQVDSATADDPSAPGTFGWAGIANTFFWVDPRNGLIGMVWTQHLPFGAYPLHKEVERLVYAALAPSAASSTP
jgi:CubicO group peptidase (beta-lactamase class C family)